MVVGTVVAYYNGTNSFSTAFFGLKIKVVYYLLDGVTLVVLLLRCPAPQIFYFSFFSSRKSSRRVVSGLVGKAGELRRTKPAILGSFLPPSQTNPGKCHRGLSPTPGCETQKKGAVDKIRDIPWNVMAATPVQMHALLLKLLLFISLVLSEDSGKEPVSRWFWCESLMLSNLLNDD